MEAARTHNGPKGRSSAARKTTPQPIPHNSVTHLQQKLGNQAMQSMLHPDAGTSNLTFGSNNDSSERAARSVGEIASTAPTLTAFELRPSVLIGGAADVPPIHPPDTGVPPPDAVRARIESILGANLAGVRIHQSAIARETAKQFVARAFTCGEHIWLGPGESSDDVRLISHEMTHVVQSRTESQPSIRRDDGPGGNSPPNQPGEDEQLLQLFESLPGRDVINYAETRGGLTAWKANYPRSFGEMQTRAINIYGEPAYRKVMERDSEILQLVQKSALILGKLNEFRDYYEATKQTHARDFLYFYIGHDWIHFFPLEFGHVQGLYEFHYDFFARLFSSSANANDAFVLCKALLSADPNTIIADTIAAADQAQADADAQEAQRREWAGKGAKILGQVVARKQGLTPWDTNIKLESILDPDYGSEDPNEMLALARMSGLASAVVKVEDRYYGYKLDEQYDRSDFYLVPDKDIYVQVLPAGSLDVYAITATSGFVLRPPRSGEGDLYKAGDQAEHPQTYLEADTRLLESGRARELGLSPISVFQSMVLNLTLVNLQEAEKRMHDIQRQMKDVADQPDKRAGTNLNKDAARLRQIMVDLDALAAGIDKQELTDEQADQRDLLIEEAGNILDRDPAAGLFVKNNRDTDSTDPVRASDIENELAGESPESAAKKAISEAQDRLDNIATVRRAIFDDPEMVLDFEPLHAAVLARFDSDDQSSIHRALIFHSLDRAAKTLRMVARDLGLILAGFVTGGETWLGLGIHTVSTGIGIAQLREQFQQASILSAMSQLDIEGGFSLASPAAARSARRWAIFGGALTFFGVVGLGRTASRLMAASRREANLVRRIASRAGVGEDVLAAAFRRGWTGIPNPDPDALRQILLASMEPGIARRYTGISIKILTEEQWTARYGANSTAHAETTFTRNAAGEVIADQVFFRRSGNVFALQEEAAHITQAADPHWAQSLKQAADLNPGAWNTMSMADKLRATRNVLNIELDAQERLLARAQRLGDTESMDDAFAHMEALSQKLVDIDEKLANSASTRYLRWFDPSIAPSIFASPRLPRSLGTWSGVPGNSVWNSTNPDVISIIGKGEGVRFRNGYPNFSKWSVGQINLGEMSGFADDFAEADAAFAKGVMNGTREPPPGFTRQDFIFRDAPNAAATQRYRQIAGLTWHHHQGGKLMLLVPTKLHANVPHTGGASAARAG
jgi:hypothetical protein